MTCVAGTVGLSRSRVLCVALSSFYAATTNAVVLGAAAQTLPSPSYSHLRGLKRDRGSNVPKSPKAHTCTIEVVMLAPDGSPSIEGMDEIYQCTIDPDDVPGGYAGLTRKLDLSRSQKRSLKKMWKEGRLVPGQTQLKLADIEEVTMSEEVVEAVDEMTVAKEDMLEGVPIDVSDIQIPTVFDVEELLVDGDVNHERELQTSFGSHVGIKPTLVVKVIDVNDKARPESPMEISDDIFGTNGDPVNLRSQMCACSMGRVDFVPGDNNYGIDQSMYDAPGVITVKIEISLENNTRTGIENAITAKVQDKLHMTLPGPYKHVMYIVEKCYVNCGYAAYAYVNKYISVYQGENYKYVGVLMHEIGHNFGLAHSGGKDGVGTYTDHTDLMVSAIAKPGLGMNLGDPHYQDDTGKMCYNPAKNWQIGWYNDRKTMLTPHSEISGWETIVTIVGIADYQKNTRFPVVLKLETGAANDYFIGFNRAAEINADNKEADDQLTIVLSGSHGESYSQSWLKATLQVSEQYRIRNFGGVNGMDIVIILDSIDEPGDGSWQANVKVIKSDPTVSPTLSPTTLTLTALPSSSPTEHPIAEPTVNPTVNPTNVTPTALPSASPTEHPTRSPTNHPTTAKPTSEPTSSTPTSSLKPTGLSTETSSSVNLRTPLCEEVTVGSTTKRKCIRQHGNMFDVKAKDANITITAMTISVFSGTSAQVWSKSGSYIGSEYSSVGWTKVGEISYSGTGLKTIPLTQIVNIGARSSRAFYVTATNGLVKYGAAYSNDSADAVVVEDNYVVVYPGSANIYPFSGLFSPRWWNGGLTYRKI